MTGSVTPAKQWPSLLTLLFSGLAAVGAIWQGYLITIALKSPYTANLQSKQLDACAEFLAKAESVKSSFIIWLDRARGENRLTTSIEVPEIQVSIQAHQAVLDFSSAAKKLSLLAADETKSTVSSVTSSNAAFGVLLLNKDPGSQGSAESWITQFEANVDKVTRVCREAMIGQKVGLL